MSDIDKLLGENLSLKEVEKLLVENRISFPFKPTTVSAVSQSSESPDKDKGTTQEDNVDDYINSVKDNEALIKMLEDMRDDMLAGMKIPPATDDISAAAKKLGSTDGSINKDIWDTATTIINTIPQNQTNNDPVIGAITGNGTLTGDFLSCNEVTKAIADNWDLSADKDGDKTPDELHNQDAKRSVNEAKASFSKKMKTMAKYIFRMLWWNLIWGRLVMFFLETTEKIIAVPIDTPFLILRFFKRLTKKNYMKYGPVHKLLNRLKILLLCKVPKKSKFGPDYTPDDEIRVWYPTGKKGKWMSLKELCSQEYDIQECPQGTSPWPDVESQIKETWPKDDADDMQTSIRDKLSEAFPEGDSSCIPTSFLDGVFNESNLEGPGMSPNCVEAAKIVMEAVQDDALHYSQYDSVMLDNVDMDYVIDGDIKKAQGKV